MIIFSSRAHRYRGGSRWVSAGVLSVYVGISDGVVPAPDLIDLVGEYRSSLDLVGAYAPTIDRSGSYVTTIDLTGEADTDGN